jgi:thiol:disulfide interchange protein DsbC
MIKKILAVSSSLIIASASLTNNIERDLVQSVIPKTKIAKIKHTPIDGLYEVFLPNGNVLYVYPYKKLILFGEIYTNTGINLTNRDRTVWINEVNQKNLKKLNAKELTKNAFKLKFGKGSKRYAFVIFTDPECPFCRKVDNYLKTEKPNTTFYVNYMPLYFHPHAHKWALQILSSKDKKKAIETIEKNNKDLNVTITNEAKNTLKATQALAKKLNIRGTPTLFVIDTKTDKVVAKIDGANIPEIKKWIEKDNNEK